MSNALLIIKWTEAFTYYLQCVIRVCNTPLAYVIHADAAVPALIPALEAGMPHSAEHGRIEWR